MATVITTISDTEMRYRCSKAAATLWENPQVSVRLSPGLFRASEWTPRQLIQYVLNELGLSEAERTSWIVEVQEDYEEPEWRVWITRRQDGVYILKARRVF